MIFILSRNPYFSIGIMMMLIFGFYIDCIFAIILNLAYFFHFIVDKILLPLAILCTLTKVVVYSAADLKVYKNVTIFMMQ